EDLADLWAMERTGAFRGRYHVLGGTLSALDGVGPEELNIARLIARLGPESELILALNATVDGQTTAHYIADRAAATGARTSRLAVWAPIASGSKPRPVTSDVITTAANRSAAPSTAVSAFHTRPSTAIRCS